MPLKPVTYGFLESRVAALGLNAATLPMKPDEAKQRAKDHFKSHIAWAQI